MSGEQGLECITKPAASDLRQKQYRFVKLNSSGKLALAADGGKATGILQNAPNTDEAGACAYEGRSFLVLGDTVTQGNDVASDTNGEGVPPATGDEILAEALESGVDGDIISVLFHPRGTT